MDPRGRMFQDVSFEVVELRNRKLEQLVGYTCEVRDKSSEAMFLKVPGKHWQRFFLDAGLGFWEEWSEGEVFQDYEGLRRIDYGSMFGLAGELIEEAICTAHGRGRLPRFVQWQGVCFHLRARIAGLPQDHRSALRRK